jgi:hypothetical protein
MSNGDFAVASTEGNSMLVTGSSTFRGIDSIRIDALVRVNDLINDQ